MSLPFQKKLIAVFCVSAAAGIASASPAVAAAADKAGMQTQTNNQQASRYIRASKMIGMSVKNTKGENLGEIKDLIVDVANERVYYAVLEFGGFLGMGEKLFAYPVRVFRTAADRDDLILNVDAAKLKAAPGFARDNWPDWSSYRSDVDRYHGPTVSLKPMPGQMLRRASELIGKDVNDRSGNDIGEIEDIVVNMGNGRIHYAVLEFDRSWNLNDKLLAVPMRTFTFPADRNELVMNVDKSRLDTKRVFDKNRWPDLNDPKYVVDVDRYLVTVVTTAPARGTASSSGKPDVMTTSVDHTKSMEDLLQAAQRLRESIQSLAQQPVGPKRSEAIRGSREALLQTQRAMLELPAELRVESVERVDANAWPKAAARLQQASEKLRQSLEAMSKQASGKGRAAAMATARQALQDTQQALLAMPDYGSK